MADWTEWYRITYRLESGPAPSRTPLGFASFHSGRQTVQRAGLACTVNPSYGADSFSFVAITTKNRAEQMKATLPEQMSGGSSIIITDPDPPTFERRRELWRMGGTDAKAAGHYADRETDTVVALDSVELIKSDPDGNTHVASQCPGLIESPEKDAAREEAATDTGPEQLTDTQREKIVEEWGGPHDHTSELDPEDVVADDGTDDPGGGTASTAVTGTLNVDNSSLLLIAAAVALVFIFADDLRALGTKMWG